MSVSIDERLGYLLLGLFIGFVVGYVVRGLREIIKKERDVLPHRDERGFTRVPLVADIALLLVIVVTVWAAFQSQAATNEVRDTQSKLTRISVCNQQYLTKTIDALNERTQYTQNQAQSNVLLQRQQKNFLSIFFVKPPATAEQRALALKRYFVKVNKFVDDSQNAVEKISEHPYPTSEELDACLNPTKEK